MRYIIVCRPVNIDVTLFVNIICSPADPHCQLEDDIDKCANQPNTDARNIELVHLT